MDLEKTTHTHGRFGTIDLNKHDTPTATFCTSTYIHGIAIMFDALVALKQRHTLPAVIKCIGLGRPTESLFRPQARGEYVRLD